MDPIELEAMLNSDNKEERIRARRLVRPRVRAPARDPFPIAILFATRAREHSTRGRSTHRLLVVPSRARLMTPF